MLTYFVLVIMVLNSQGKALDASVKFSDRDACEQAGRQIVEAAGITTLGGPIAKTICIEVR